MLFQFQLLCLLAVGLEAVRVLNPCCQKEYKTHDEYYEDEEYYLPQRYGYGHRNHHHGHNEHSKNVGYKPINPPSNRYGNLHYGHHDHSKHVGYDPINPPLHHEESLRDHHNHHKPREEHHEYEYLKLKLQLDELERKNQQHDEPHTYDMTKSFGYKRVNPSMSNVGRRYEDHDHHNIRNEHDIHEYEMPISQEHAYQQRDQHNHHNHAIHDDYRQNSYIKGSSEYHDHDHDIIPNTYGHRREHDDHRPQTYLPTIHHKGDHGVHGKYEYLLPGILRSLQEPAKQDQETLVTIYAYKPKKQHGYPKNFTQAVDYLYNREKQYQENRHTKFVNFDMQDNRQPNYYPKPQNLH